MKKLITWEQILNHVPDYHKNCFEEGIEDVIGMASESYECKSFEFFDIEYDEEKGLTLPENFDIKKALNVIDDYLAIVEDEDVENDKAYEYDKYTQPHRGADDGTYDYAGSYVSIIFECIKNILEK